MEALAALSERITGLGQRVSANHSSIGDLRASNSQHEVKLAVIASDLEDIHDDIKEIKGQLKWVLRGLWAGAGTLALCALALASLVAR